MKKITYKLLFCAWTLFGFTSCNSFLELKPITELPADNALTNGKNVEATLASGYGNLASGDFLGERVQTYSELSSDNIALNEIAFSATDFTGQVAFRNTNILNKDVDNLWQTAYRAIGRANAVIDAIDKSLITDGTAITTQKIWKAEALFIRAVAHFELVRLYAKPFSAGSGNPGVPLRLKYLSADEKLSRATVDEVYTQVITDLTNAALDLPTTFNGNRANKWAARGYLARVYFNKLDYQNAFTAATDVATNSGLSLNGPYTPFRNVGNVAPTGGVVWQIVNGGNPFGAYRPASKRYSIFQGTGSLKEALDASSTASAMNDARANTTGTQTEAGPPVRVYSKKWDVDGLNIPIIRLAEILLIHAESAAEINNLPVASASYNAVRANSVTGYTPITFSSQATARTEIRKERRIELMFEGDRYHELRRQKVATMSGVPNLRPAVSYDDRTLLLPIPVSETSGNPAIVQN